MATLAATTLFSFDKGATTQTVTLSATATAGMTLVLVNTGAAVVTANLTSSGGTAFTKRTHAVGTLEVAVQDVVCAGGETHVVLTLSGAQTIDGIIYHFPGLGAYISSGNNGAGAAPAAANDLSAITTALAVTGNAVLVAGFDVVASGVENAINSWHGFGPLGAFYAQLGHSTGTGTKHNWASALADITAAASFPASQAAGSYQAVSQWLSNTNTLFAAAAAYADTSGIATNPAPANTNVAENSLPGTPQANWYITNQQTVDPTIAGYCDKLSYSPGDTVHFFVDSTNNPFRVEIYRLGFYGSEMNGARNVLGSGTGASAGYITGSPVVQGSPSVDSTYGFTSCAGIWTATASWTIPASAASGVYQAIFRRTDITTHLSAGMFVVKGATAKGKVAVIVNDFTWHAYNVWGATTDNGTLAGGTWTGRSLYGSGADGGTTNPAHRAYAVSFDRPYGSASTSNVNFIYDDVQPLMTFLEAQGYDLVYYSDVDLENDSPPSLLTTAKLVCPIGHQEYWCTTNAYNSIRATMDAGVPFMIQSSNTSLWHTRFAASDTTKRVLICYKDSLTKDVSAGFTGTGYDPVSYTGTWRDTRTSPGTVNNTDIRPENATFGQLCVMDNGIVTVQITVPFASKGEPIWRNSAGVQALTAGNSYAVNIVQASAGYELDAPDGSAGQPPNLVSLNPYSTGSLADGANQAGTIYTTTVTQTCSFTLYRRYASRALIFNTGAWRGWFGVTRFCNSTYAGASNVPTPDVNWQNALLAIMYDLGVAPGATAAVSMKPGLDTAVTAPSTGAPAAPSDKTGVARAYGLRCPEDGLFMAVML